MKLKYISEIKISSVDKHIYPIENQVIVCNYTDVYYNEFITNKLDFKKGSCSSDEYSKFKLFKGDVIITKDSETANDIGIPSFVIDDIMDLVCGYHLTIIRTYKDILLGIFLFRELQTIRIRRYFEINANGITRFGLGKSSVLDTPIILPLLEEQEQIVAYLDEKTTNIDKLLVISKRKIGLLKEQRASIINQVVTKGLNPNAKMKHSGVEWIGDIPEGWGVIKIKHIGTIKSGDGINSILIEKIGLYPVYGGNGIMGYFNDYNYSHSVLCIGRVGEKCGNVHIIYEKSWISDNSLVLDIDNSRYNIEYIYYTLQTRDLNVLRNQNTQPLITGTIVKNEYIPMPNLKCQLEIVNYINSFVYLIDKSISIEERRIGLLKEYRQSIISQVITGKIKVIADE